MEKSLTILLSKRRFKDTSYIKTEILDVSLEVKNLGYFFSPALTVIITLTSKVLEVFSNCCLSSVTSAAADLLGS